MGQQLGAQGRFQPIVHGFPARHGKVHLAVRAGLHRRDGPQRGPVDLGDHLFHGRAPAVVSCTAQGPAAGGEDGQPQVPVCIKSKAGQLSVHAQDGRKAAAIGAHKVTLPLFQGRAVVRSRIHKAVLLTDAVHALIVSQSAERAVCTAPVLWRTSGAV